MAEGEEPVLVRLVRPEGNLLNDNDCGVDQLGYLVYAQSLAKLLHGASPPITVGIFGPWGIGKTFLLKHVQGHLRKYQQQDNLKDFKPNLGCCVCPRKDGPTTEEDGPISNSHDDEPRFKPRNKTRKTNMNRACRIHCFWITVLILFLLVILVILFLILLLNSHGASTASRHENSQTALAPQSKRADNEGTASSDNEAGPGKKLAAKISPVIPEAANLTGDVTPALSFVTATTTTGETEVITSNVRTYLILALVVLTGMVLAVFCSCVANTDSKCWTRFCNNCKLVWYAAFTRIPSVAVSSDTDWIEARNPYMVANFDDERAQLQYVDPSDEENISGAKISSNKDRKMPKKYIFVNYHAWQYAGSDTLWAGIVTNLAEAIETEFGAVCARLFRMLEVERPSKFGPIKLRHEKEDPRALYVRFRFPDENWNAALRRERAFDIMTQYGVVSQCERYRERWWYVRFCTDKEASFAEKALKQHKYLVSRLKAEVNRMATDGSQSPEINHRDEIDGNDEIPMVTLGASRGANGGVGRETELTTSTTTRSQIFEENVNCCCCCLPKKCCRWFCHFRKHPKTVCCGCPFLYCCVLFVIMAVLFPIGICIMADKLELGLLKSPRAIPVEAQIFSWMPAMVGVLIVALRFCWAMCNSQTERVRKALAGSSGSMGKALGFMNEVKREVMIMTQLINCVRFTHGIDYKVVITIDDLDRCPYDKVKSVLEAVSILLSDRSSPFLCLIAVDSRVAVKCIEQDMGELLLQAHLTGHEYLKKIVNLPFCLPEVADNAKRKYIGGILDFADGAVVERVASVSDVVRQEPTAPSANDGANAARFNDHLDAIVAELEPNPIKAAAVDLPDDQNLDGTSVSPATSTDGAGGAGPVTADVSPVQNDRWRDVFSKFRFECIKILQGNGDAGRLVHQHMSGNPRNIKRIFNVLNLSVHLMTCIQERKVLLQDVVLLSESARRHARSARGRSASIMNADLRPQTNEFGRNPDDAADLVKWIVAADQWPYRISYILQVVEDCDQRHRARLGVRPIDQTTTLSHIYEKYVEPEIASDVNSAAMLTLDNDPAVLRSFLRQSATLTRKKISSLFPVTLNLDQSLRNGIARQRALPKTARDKVPGPFHKVQPVKAKPESPGSS